MATRKRGKAADVPKNPVKWSAEAFGEGGYEVVPPDPEMACLVVKYPVKVRYDT